MNDLNKSGIYMILNLINSKFYIGSAVILRKRRDLHNLDLKNNRSHSRYLQHAYNKYGSKAFEFKILQYCHKDWLLFIEQEWIDWLKPYNVNVGYNICKSVERSRLGVKSTSEHINKIVKSNTGQKRSKETCIKIGLAKKGIKLTEERKQARRDYRHTEESKKKISDAAKGRKHTESSKILMSINKKKNLVKSLPFKLTSIPITIGI